MCKFKGFAWRAYDAQCRSRAACDLSLGWDMVDLELWTVTFSGLDKPPCPTCSSFQANICNSGETTRMWSALSTRAIQRHHGLWPGEFIEVDVPPDLEQDSIIAIEPRIDTCAWPQPQIVEAVGHKVRIENTSDEPQKIRRHEHICQARPTKDPTTSSTPSPSLTQDLPAKPKPSPPLLR